MMPNNPYFKKGICTAYTDSGDTKYIALTADKPGIIGVAAGKSNESIEFLGYITLSQI